MIDRLAQSRVSSPSRFDLAAVRSHFKQIYNDWAFGVVMFALCAALTILQYHWTGEVADAEMSRLRSNLDVQAHAMTRAFDTELTTDLRRLVPDITEFSNRSLQEAHLARFKAWQSTNPRPILKRLAIAVVEGDGLKLLLFDPASNELVPTNWPAEWATLNGNLTGKIYGRSTPFDDERGLLADFPVFDGSPRSDREHWLIAELDLNYIHGVWLPELSARYLDSGGEAVNEAIVRTAGSPPVVLYTSQTNLPVEGAPLVSVPFNFLGRPLRGSSRPPAMGGRWLLETWQPPGALEALVSAARLRNFAVAVAINLIMLATAIVLVHHTRRSREVAEQQMKFVANVSHELRTPLTVIRGAAHNIQRGVVTAPGQVEKYSTLIVENCEHLTDMIEQVLALAGAQKNPSAATRRTVLVPDVLSDAIAATAHDVSAAHCKLDLELPPTLPTVTGDASALRRVFQNLITNAAKHGGQGGWIGVTAVATRNGYGPVVEVQIADRGPGIPEKELSEIFKPFFRGERASRVRGSGLGLNLVREIVEAHSGDVSARSENGRGAIFTVRLPAAGPDIT